MEFLSLSHVYEIVGAESSLPEETLKELNKYYEENFSDVNPSLIDYSLFKLINAINKDGDNYDYSQLKELLYRYICRIKNKTDNKYIEILKLILIIYVLSGDYRIVINVLKSYYNDFLESPRGKFAANLNFEKLYFDLSKIVLINFGDPSSARQLLDFSSVNLYGQKRDDSYITLQMLQIVNGIMTQNIDVINSVDGNIGTIVDEYFEFIDLNEKMHSEELVVASDELLNKIGKEYRKTRSTMRRYILLYICAMVKKISLIPSVVELEKSEKKSQLQGNALYYALLLNEDFNLILSRLGKDFLNQNIKILYDLANVSYEVDRIRCLLKNDECDEAIYYSSISTFEKMLENGRFFMMNVAYMNDPNEGKLLNGYLFPEYKIDELKYPYVFAKCFSNKKDDLPMWKMYGDDARGCCVTIDLKTAQSAVAIQSYNVCYVSLKNNRLVINKKYNNRIKNTKAVSSSLEIIKNRINKSSKDVFVRKSFMLVLDRIAYLFKDQSYYYEEEFRVIKSFVDYTNQEINVLKSGDNKLLYVDFGVKPFIKEVVLGPKAENIDMEIPYMQYALEKYKSESGRNAPTIIKKSNIDYR